MGAIFQCLTLSDLRCHMILPAHRMTHLQNQINSENECFRFTMWVTACEATGYHMTIS